MLTLDLALILSGILALGIGAQWLGWYLKQPSILFLLLIGIIIGPILGLFNPDEALGDLLFPFISLGVAVILFEGSLTLEFHEVKSHGRVVQMLVSVGVLITIIIVSVAAYFLFDMDPKIAILFGALVCVTGPTVIVPILRSLRPNKNISNILRWEGIIIDPIGAIAVVLVYEYIISGGSGDHALLVFGKILLVSILIGLIGAYILAQLFKRHLIPEYLRNVFALAYVLLLFSISNHIEHESGLLTVTILGVALANWPKFEKEDLLDFKESLSLLLISVLFIVLAARLNLDSLMSIGIPSLILLAVVMFVARPISVWTSSIGSRLKFNEKLMISWIGPRGIVAAAISSLFAIKLAEYNLAGTEYLVPLVFVVIIGTVLIQSLTAKPIGNLLKVRETSDNGVLIIGSNPVALKVAQSLKDSGFDVIMAHNNYTNISRARMEGIKTYFGNPVSDHADRHLDLVGFGHLFAMSMDRELNTLCEINYRHAFGKKNIYRLRYNDDKFKNERQDRNEYWQSPWLFGESINYGKLASMIANNAKIKITNITDNYSYEQYRADNKNYVALYMIDKSGSLKIFCSETGENIPRGTKIISLVIEPEDKKKVPNEKPSKTGQKKLKALAEKEKKIDD
ncbi:cation:proton antiporter [Kangiella sediminilitoris]|uniref:Sodium/hydrogen exchanger n=1 Tax=Kangiella sediminilitoris TaxID=1144748 RepID=A0A1B3BAD6_9GAMM|nr:sodium:proton antiporter [Kangiella sediminilitoris]AOE49772.1 Sodium/hydrogen exchanger [Kangiella sediminilitoris]